MNPPPAPLRIGVIGLGGYAAVHHRDLARMEAGGDPVRVVAACDPAPDAFAADRARWRFAARGVRVYHDYRDLLAAPASRLGLIVLPTPIPLHAEMHRAAVRAGVPVYLEKPPTLDPRELEAMIACDTTARKATQVGFNFIAEPARLALKRRLLYGEFGRLLEARLSVQWARAVSYFTRNDWAGRLRAADGRLVLDSCCGNAMAHFVHNLLHWAGTDDLMAWCDLVSVRARLHRAHAIEGADTFFVSADTHQGVALRLALTHACTGPESQCETLVCEHATLDYVVGSHYEIRHLDGRVERTVLPPFDPVVENHRAYHRYLRDEATRPVTRLVDCRPFVQLHALAYISSGEITPLPDAESLDTGHLHVPGLAEAGQRFLATGRWPDGEAPPAVTPADLPRLAEVIEQMTSPSIHA